MPRILTPKPLSSKIVRPSYKDAPGESSVLDEVWVREPRLMVPRMQPLGNVSINKSHPAFPGMTFAMLGNRGRDLVNGRTPASSTSATFGVAKPGGLSLSVPNNVNSAGVRFTANATEASTSLACTYLVVGQYGAKANLQGLIWQGNNTTGDRSLTISNTGVITMSGWTGSVTTATAASAAGAADGTLMCIIGSVSSAGVASVWKNGVNITSTKTDSTTTDQFTSYLHINGFTDSAVQRGAEWTMFAVIWPLVGLSSAWCSELSKDPYQFLIPA